MNARYNHIHLALGVLALMAASLLPGPVIAQEATPLSAQPAAITCNVQSTPEYTEYYGDVRIEGIPAPIGAVVEALNGQGVQAGCFVVTIPGLYGYMRVYGADPDTGTPGMVADEIVTFRVNGAVANSTPSPVPWSSDKGLHAVNLGAVAVPDAIDDLAATIDVDKNVVLTWTDVAGNVDHYEVWRGETPFFAPQAPWGTCIADNVARPGQSGGTVTFTDTADHLGNAAINDYYLILGVTAGGAKSPVGNRAGAFDFGLTKGS